MAARHLNLPQLLYGSSINPLLCSQILLSSLLSDVFLRVHDLQCRNDTACLKMSMFSICALHRF